MKYKSFANTKAPDFLLSRVLETYGINTLGLDFLLAMEEIFIEGQELRSKTNHNKQQLSMLKRRA